MMGLFSLLVAMALPFSKPAYQVTVEKDVPYATAPGYYTHAPIGDKGATARSLSPWRWTSMRRPGTILRQNGRFS